MQRAAVLHRYVLDLPYAAIAEALGCSVEAARANAYEGRRRLRNHLIRGAQAANERTRASVAPRTDKEAR
jgi:DNA-directed RNA polymerase specialized sigma24 family protein